MDKKYLLGVDVGTTSIKVVVIDENAKPLGISSSSYRLITPDQNSVQIDMEDMWNAYLKCIRLLQEGKKLDLSKVAGISISSLCPGLVAMGENGEVLVDAIIYSDRRSTEEAEMILDAVGKDRLFELQPILPGLEQCPEHPCSGSNATFRNNMKKQNILAI